jgi:metallo-beta-lactamase class B
MPRTLKICMLLAAVCSLISGITREQYRVWNTPVKPFRIIGNVYYVGASDLTSFVITSPQGHILLDGGLPETASQIERNVAALGFHIRDVKILLNSHAHFDHAGGLAELKRVSGARMVASHQDAQALMSGDKDDFAWPGRGEFPAVHVDQVVSDGQTLRVGETAITAHVTSGHTKGCTTWTMAVNDGGRSYQVVFVCSTSAPGYQLVGNKRYPDIVADYEQTFRTLRSLPCDVFLAYHGSFFDLKEKHEAFERGQKPNPFIDPGGYRSFIDRTEHEFRERLSDQTAKQKAS